MRARGLSTITSLSQCILERSALRGGPLRLVSKTTQEDVERKAAAGARRAAVLVPICVVDGELSCVFCVRSAAVSTHKSQVSFPGGHREDGESAADAALRETAEEFGERFRAGFEVVDRCLPIPAITGTVVDAIVATREAPVDLLADVSRSEDEVDAVFSLPLSHLLEHREVRDYGNRGQLPVFAGGPEEIWGLTAYILDGVLERLVKPCWKQPTRSPRDTAMF